MPQLLLLRTSHTRTVNSLTIENEPAAVLSAISGSQWLQLFSINSQAFLNDFLCSQFSAFSAFSASSFSVVVTTTTVAVTARATPGLDATLLRSVSPGAWSGWTLAQPVERVQFEFCRVMVFRGNRAKRAPFQRYRAR